MKDIISVDLLKICNFMEWVNHPYQNWNNAYDDFRCFIKKSDDASITVFMANGQAVRIFVADGFNRIIGDFRFEGCAKQSKTMQLLSDIYCNYFGENLVWNDEHIWIKWLNANGFIVYSHNVYYKKLSNDSELFVFPDRSIDKCKFVNQDSDEIYLPINSVEKLALFISSIE